MAEKSGCGCGAGSSKRNVLLYACSGGANVAEMADRAARELMFAGQGSMFCLAGLGAGIGNMVAQAKQADVNLVLEGCPLDCAKKIFDNAGVTNYTHVRVTDLGIEKKKGVRISDADVTKVVAKAREVLTTT